MSHCYECGGVGTLAESDDRADFAEEWAREDKLDREREWDSSYAYVDDERTW